MRTYRAVLFFSFDSYIGWSGEKIQNPESPALQKTVFILITKTSIQTTKQRHTHELLPSSQARPLHVLPSPPLLSLVLCHSTCCCYCCCCCCPIFMYSCEEIVVGFLFPSISKFDDKAATADVRSVHGAHGTYRKIPRGLLRCHFFFLQISVGLEHAD